MSAPTVHHVHDGTIAVDITPKPTPNGHGHHHQEHIMTNTATTTTTTETETEAVNRALGATVARLEDLARAGLSVGDLAASVGCTLGAKLLAAISYDGETFVLDRTNEYLEDFSEEDVDMVVTTLTTFSREASAEAQANRDSENYVAITELATMFITTASAIHVAFNPSVAATQEV